jgi:hypothetical protein
MLALDEISGEFLRTIQVETKGEREGRKQDMISHNFRRKKIAQ